MEGSQSVSQSVSRSAGQSVTESVSRTVGQSSGSGTGRKEGRIYLRLVLALQVYQVNQLVPSFPKNKWQKKKAIRIVTTIYMGITAVMKINVHGIGPTTITQVEHHKARSSVTISWTILNLSVEVHWILRRVPPMSLCIYFVLLINSRLHIYLAI